MRRTYFFVLALIGVISYLPAARSQQSVFVPATMASAPIAITTATTTLLVTGRAGASIYITAMDVVAAGTGNIQFISGTGATCGTGTANVTGNYNLTAQTGLAKGTGNGALWVIPAGASLCAVTSAAVTMSGSLAYAIF